MTEREHEQKRQIPRAVAEHVERKLGYEYVEEEAEYESTDEELKAQLSSDEGDTEDYSDEEWGSSDDDAGSQTSERET